MIMGKLLVILFTFFLFQSPLSANDNLDTDPLANIKVSKEDILKSMEALKKQGKISEADYQNAKKELEAMSDSQVNSITDTAVDVIKKDPDKAVGLLQGAKIDTNEVKKQVDSVSKPKK